jgi:hypothetical protein
MRRKEVGKRRKSVIESLSEAELIWFLPAYQWSVRPRAVIFISQSPFLTNGTIRVVATGKIS